MPAPAGLVGFELGRAAGRRPWSDIAGWRQQPLQAMGGRAPGVQPGRPRGARDDLSLERPEKPSADGAPLMIGVHQQRWSPETHDATRAALAELLRLPI